MQEDKKTKINVSTDIVVTIGWEEIVLIKRVSEPFQDKLCLPGGFFEPDKDEDILESCYRESREEISLEEGLRPSDFTLLTVLSKKGRDPRPWGPRVSIVYWITINRNQSARLQPKDDAKEIVIKRLDELKPDEIGFDHWDAICDVRSRIKEARRKLKELDDLRRRAS
jgi:ADP-ribose pyrophosphatase YjhB (NUDIX family)